LNSAARVRLFVFLGVVAVVILLIVVVAIIFGGGNTVPSASSGARLEEGKQYTTDDFKPAFSFEVGEGWTTAGAELPDILDITHGGSSLGFLNPKENFDPSKPGELATVPVPEDMVAWFQAHPGFRAEQPEPVQVGGVSGVQFDTLVTEAPEDYPPVCGGPCVNLFPLSDGGGWAFSEAEKNRVIILDDVEGETVVITFGGPAVDFEEFLPKAQKVLDTVKWEDA
jgi:hypothetical protein